MLHFKPIPPQSILATASAAEGLLGFDCLWASEINHDPFLQLVLAAEYTTTMQLGTAIAVAFARSPMHMAYVAWDMARYRPRTFSLGPGHASTSAYREALRHAVEQPGCPPA